MRIRMARLERGELRARRPARKALAGQVPQDEARRVLLAPFAAANDRLFAAFEGKERIEGAVAVHALEEVVELARRARIDLDDAERPARRIHAHLDVEHAVAKAGALDELHGERIDASSCSSGNVDGYWNLWNWSVPGYMTESTVPSMVTRPSRA